MISETPIIPDVLNYLTTLYKTKIHRILDEQNMHCKNTIYNITHKKDFTTNTTVIIISSQESRVLPQPLGGLCPQCHMEFSLIKSQELTLPVTQILQDIICQNDKPAV